MDNYKAVRENWQRIFARMDHAELKKRFGLREDENCLYISYFQEEYGLDKRTGEMIFLPDREQEISFNTAMVIYNLFYYSRPGASVQGTFVPFRQVKRAAPFEAAYQRTILEPLARTLDGHGEELRQACEALKGQPIPQGDVGYVIHAFPWMPLTIVFWDGDEEFPAQANILFDADITEFLHEETVVCVASDFARQLAQKAGLGKIEQLMGGSI